MEVHIGKGEMRAKMLIFRLAFDLCQYCDLDTRQRQFHPWRPLHRFVPHDHSCKEKSHQNGFHFSFYEFFQASRSQQYCKLGCVEAQRTHSEVEFSSVDGASTVSVEQVEDLADLGLLCKL